MIPAWLHILAFISLAFGLLCAAAIVADEIRHPQPMRIMNLVWPLVALFGSIVWWWGYRRFGHRGKDNTPLSVLAAKAASHCGAGCTLGDICAEWLAFAFPAMTIWFGWHSLFHEKIFAVWVMDFLFAYAFGIVFQYFTIAPMRHLGLWQGVRAAVKADTLSLTAWQLGMYSFMAIAYFWIFGSLLHTELRVNSMEFWFMMQIAMLCGFATSYPVNQWLLKKRWKEKM